jgi:hypothetical protein
LGDVSDERSGESVSHRPPSRVAHRRSGIRKRGQGDQVASHNACRGNVIVDTSEDSACQSAYYSARESWSGSPVEGRRHLEHYSYPGEGRSHSTRHSDPGPGGTNPMGCGNLIGNGDG